MDSPPKRMTRARAAARARADSTKPTRILTAAARARSLSTVTASTKSTSAKRKARDDETDDTQGGIADMNTRRAVRARAEHPETAELVSRESRSKAYKKTTVVAPADDYVPAAGRTRGRIRKAPSQRPTPAGPPVDKEATQTRDSTSTMSKTTLETKKVTRRTIKFQRPGKENVSLVSKAEETLSDPILRGLRGPTTRRTAAAVPTHPTEKVEKKPLSPKKVTQMPIIRDKGDSEDELPSGDRAVITVKSPKRIPTGEVLTGDASLDISIEHTGEKYRDAAKLKAGPVSALSESPARRTSSSPLRDTSKSPAKTISGLQLLGSNLQVKTSSTAEQSAQTSSKHSQVLFQSLAQRLPSAIEGLNFHTRSFDRASRDQASTVRSCSLLQTPAKRALPAAWSTTDDSVKVSALSTEPQNMPMSAAAFPATVSARPSDLLLAEEPDDASKKSTADSCFDAPIENPRFSGRMWAVSQARSKSRYIEEAGADQKKRNESLWAGNAISEAGKCEPLSLTLKDSRPTYQVQHLSQAFDAVQQANRKDPMNPQEVIAGLEDTEEVSGLKIKTEVANDMPRYESKLPTYHESMDFCPVKSNIEIKDDMPTAKTTPVVHGGIGRQNSHLGYLTRTPRHSRRSSVKLISSSQESGSWSTKGTGTVQVETPTFRSDDSKSTFPKDGFHGALFTFEADTPANRSQIFQDKVVVDADFPPSKEPRVTQPVMDESNFAAEDVAMLEDDHTSISAEEVPMPEENHGLISMEEVFMVDEDASIAQEANGPPLKLQREVKEVTHHRSCEETLSECSQEYGDENEMPVESTLARRQPPQMATPARSLQPTVIFTTTKIPLKPADDSEASLLKERGSSAGRASYIFESNLPRSATVSLCSPTEDKMRASIFARGNMLSTPIQVDQRSRAVTPSSSPRRDVDPELLRGCVVLVDVHTIEGADASGIFVELLTQMGAKCVKTWHWNPEGSGNGNSSSSKVGITHVIFKDGGKRTMEKVRETRGVVHCVGVSWVLDCERENEWLDEAPYYLDTSVIPRGGARRRKSMEPKAITSSSETIATCTNKKVEKLSTPKNRRESTLWMHTPLEQGGGDDDEDLEWSCALLTPVPKTPASEAVAKYASEISVTPSSEENTDLQSPIKQSLLTRTCPPKEGRGALNQDKDDIMRLMAARRKSLQFAPKIGSPLARTWS
ncbi:hypothetical protein E4U17_007366 [Claviceps sp. LM77 group G4]|nr:hypothetical protein E4U17_007366 [Claviceps sp. LM77 group G4]KAG6057679.1 hypothetical protein E4U33_007431 [Claviceps sp. LM78 group G4]KAG6069959.1 hypothetical protein E4U16_007234 [Claviceps sp. LM84 group G4]